MKRILLFTLLAASIMSCTTKPTTTDDGVTRLFGEIKNSDITYMMLVNMDRVNQDTVFFEDDGTFDITVDASEKHLFTLFYKKEIIEMYLQAGETLEIVADAAEFMTKPKFKGSAAEAAEVMNRKFKLTSGVVPKEILELSPADFTAHLDGVVDEVNALVDGAKLDAKLKALLKTDAFFTLLPLRDGYASRKMDLIEAGDSESFFAYQDEIKEHLLNADNLESTAFKMYVFDYLQNELMTHHQEDMTKAGDRWAIVMLNSIPEIIENAEVRDYAYHMLYQNMMMGRMIQMPEHTVEELVTTFTKQVTKEAYKKDILAEYEVYKRLKAQKEEQDI